AGVLTMPVVTVKLALDDPAGTRMLPGTLATDGLLLVNITEPPSVVLMVRVPDEAFPPTTLVGFKARDVRLALALPPVCSEPTVVDGSTAAYFLQRIAETHETAFPHDMKPRVPERNVESLAAKTVAPLIAREWDAPPIRPCTAYHVAGTNVPPRARTVRLFDAIVLSDQAFRPPQIEE